MQSGYKTFFRIKKMQSGIKPFFFLTHMECQNAMQCKDHPFQSKKKWDYLMHSTLGKFFSRRYFDFFLIFPENRM